MKKSDIIHGMILSVITMAVTFYYFTLIISLNDALKNDFKASFKNEKAVELNSGPIWFFYDKTNGQILSTKPISKEDKYTLLSLYPGNEVAPPSYVTAIDELAYNSNKETKGTFHLILFLGSLGGVLGVMIRSLSSLIYHSCFQKDLDMKIWWSWYYLRPIMGIGVGITIVVLSKTKLSIIDSAGELTGFWILGSCILAGFAISEVTDRLYYASKALFGASD